MLKLQNIRKTLVFCQSYFIRNFSSQPPKNKVVLSSDGSTVVCWHPEPPFPYECSLPLPEQVTVSTNSVLNVQATDALKAIRKPKKEQLVREELMALTYTTKHRWFPNSRVFKRKKTPVDRPFL